MPLKGGFLLCEWESPWQLTTVGQHVEGKKWQNVTSVFPCSFSLKTKGLLKSASLNGCACASVCLSKLFLLTSNQSASYHYGNHVCHSTKIKKKKKKKEFSTSIRPCLPTTLCSSFLSASCFFHVLLSPLQLIYAPISPVTGIPVKILKNTVRFSLIGFYWQHAVSPLTFTVWIFRLANISSSVL